MSSMDSSVITDVKPLQRRATTPKKATARSRVGNGKELIAGIDKRSADYREYCDVVSDLEAHLGSEPTVVESAIAEEAGGLIFWCRKERLALLKGEEFSVGAYCTAINALRRLLADIGQEARLKDVTPTLARYLEQRAARPASGTRTSAGAAAGDATATAAPEAASGLASGSGAAS